MGKTVWTIDPVHSSAELELEHMSISHYRNRFRTVTGELTLDDASPADSKLEAKIDARSIAIEDKGLYDRMMSEDFFSVEKHPDIGFVGTRFEKKADGTWTVDGQLSIRGVQKPVTLEVQGLGEANHPFAGTPMRAFRATTCIDRTDFGITWNAAMDTGAKYLGEKVNVLLHVELLKKQA